MKEQFKKFLNEEQDPKAIEKITSKLSDLLMKNEEIGYIAVQKKPAITVFPDSIVMTNKRIIICKPKNLGLSMDFIDFTWDEIEGTFVKENILGSEFSFTTKTEMQVSIDYIPKIQARKIFTFAKEQLDILKNPTIAEILKPFENEVHAEVLEDVEIQEVPSEVKEVNQLSKDELFEKLQNYKKLLDNDLISQVEYDAYKKEILSLM